MTRPFVIGVTGPIACGKSTVVSTLSELGVTTIDADAVYHDLIAPGSELSAKLVCRFGQEILDEDEAIDRHQLGEIVFNDGAALADLDRITHPEISAEIRRRIRAATTPIVAVDAVKLIESGSYRICDQVWFVFCDRQQQIDRIVDRNQVGTAVAQTRVDAHRPVYRTHETVDLVIDNRGSIENTRTQVRDAYSNIDLNPTKERVST